MLFPDVPRVTMTLDITNSVDDGDNHNVNDNDNEKLELESIDEDTDINPPRSPLSLNPSLFRRPRISAFSPGGSGFVAPRQQQPQQPQPPPPPPQQQQQQQQSRRPRVTRAWAWDDSDGEKDEEELAFDEGDEDLFSAVTAGTSHGFTTHRATPTPAAESEPVTEAETSEAVPTPAPASEDEVVGTVRGLLDSMTRFREK